MRRTLVIARTDLLRRIRNRSAIVTAFIGPLAMAIVFGLLIGGTDDVSFTVGVVDEDRSALSRQIVDDLADGDEDEAGPEEGADGAGGADGDEDVLTVRELDSAEEARSAVDDGDVDAAIVLPAGFTDARTGGTAVITVLRDPARLISGQVASSIAQSVATRFNQVNLTMTVAARPGASGGGAPPPELARTAADAAPAIRLDDLPGAESDFSPEAFFGASMSILFLFFTTAFAARSLLTERESGTLSRILATPASAASVVAGKTLAVSVLGLAGFVTVWVVTTVGFGGRWGPWAAVLALIVATVAAVGGVATLVASLARSERQADAVTSAVTFVLAIAGGNFIGPATKPELLEQLSLLTPNGWALRAFSDLSAGAATPSTIAAALAVLVVIGIVTGSAGLFRMYRMVEP